MKVCSKCEEEKPETEFYKDKGKKDGLHCLCRECTKFTNRIRYLTNIEERKKYQKEYVKNNKEKVVESRKVCYKKSREYILKRQKAYYKKHKEERNTYDRSFYEENRKALRLRQREYQKTPEGKAAKRVCRVNRIAAKTSSGGKHTVKEYRIRLKEQNYKCFYCYCDISNGKDEIEHFFPLSKGGSSNISNIVASCKTCNSRKGTKDPFDFINEITKNKV